MLDVVGIGREQHQRAEAGRADRIAFGHRFGRVADRIERVGRMTHLFRQAGHFGNAAGVVGHRTESVERDDHAGKAEHGRHRDRDAEQSRELDGDDDAADDDQSRQGRRFQRNGQPLNDIGAVPRHRSLRDRDDRPLAGAGIIFGDDDDEAGHDEAEEPADEELQPGDRMAAAPTPIVAPAD